MPNVVAHRMVGCLKAGTLRGPSLEDGLESYQLVGEVMAHQGEDG